jgi:alpha-galactosidase
MGKAIKLGVIGAGSAVFALGLVRDLCLAESLHGSEITFMDVDTERLEMMGRLATRYADELGVDLRFSTTTERDEALREADFVLNTALAGGHGQEEAWRHEAEKLGYYRGLRLQTYFHQFDLMLSLARDMERLCPNAWLIQSSNPVFEGCTLMTRQTGVKVVGLCHGFWGYRQLAAAIGVPADEVQWQAVGVNHWIYLTQLRHQGQDLYPRIDEWIETRSEEYWRTFRGGFGDTQLSRAAIDHYQRVGLMPIGDASRTFSEWYYHTDLETKRRWYGYMGGFDSQIGWEQYLAGLRLRVEKIYQAAADPSIRVTDVFPPEATHELQVPVMDAIANDNPGIYQVNVPNGGAIANIADDVVVEGKALVDAAGIHLLHVDKLPDKLMYMVLAPRIFKAEKELATYLSGDREMLLSCVLDDHQTRSMEQAQEAVNTLLCLPWNEALAERFGREELVCELGEYDLPEVEELL